MDANIITLLPKGARAGAHITAITAGSYGTLEGMPAIILAPARYACCLRALQALRIIADKALAG